MERMFIDPATGDMHPESYYRMENIDLDTLLEAFEVEDGVLGFQINVKNIERMDVKHPAVFAVFAQFCEQLRDAAMQADDEDEQQQYAEIATFVSRVMLQKLGHTATKH
jgi:ABC-type xylose transport system substrate-binding protein